MKVNKLKEVTKNQDSSSRFCFYALPIAWERPGPVGSAMVPSLQEPLMPNVDGLKLDLVLQMVMLC